MKSNCINQTCPRCVTRIVTYMPRWTLSYDSYVHSFNYNFEKRPGNHADHHRITGDRVATLIYPSRIRRRDNLRILFLMTIPYGLVPAPESSVEIGCILHPTSYHSTVACKDEWVRVQASCIMLHRKLTFK